MLPKKKNSSDTDYTLYNAKQSIMLCTCCTFRERFSGCPKYGSQLQQLSFSDVQRKESQAPALSLCLLIS